MPLSAGIFEYFLNLDFIVALTIQLRIMTTIKITQGLIAILLKFNFLLIIQKTCQFDYYCHFGRDYRYLRAG